ncbi:N-acetylmuramoyl-L-alanine amidase [Streptococcus sp. 45]|uniref:N-acetylmuramoyl-L-alanine amidase n=1 Tax=Streptococcus equinus TaxID=1335 RepID=A0A1H0Z1E9_STREI|nr:MULTISPECIES: peptidoglycan recognition family protein [Streptococcus]SDQ21249.1 N-acetylmuramoyl-L-alanine amidase [Streptococcus equinus]SDW51479.1 N-acetylmuramoyl-L-alanine amidase [Streptococcus equinus]SEI43284.1 N-acetylmuramoyl-L-alanine amidase [Streptococcus sp. 45]
MTIKKHLSRSKRHQKSVYLNISVLVISFAALLIILSKLFFSGIITHALDQGLDLSSASNYTASQTATVSSTKANIYTKNGSSTSLPKDTELSINAYYYKAKLNESEATLAEFDMNGETYYIDTKDISLQQTNAINQYIAGTLTYSHSEITDSIEKSFEQSAYKTSDGKPRGIIIHDTGVDDSTIQSEVNYMVQNYNEEGIFVHSFIDDATILRIADEKYEAQGAGTKANPYYIQFELTHETSQDGFARQLANAAYYTAYMLKKYDLPVTLGQENGDGSIWTHEMVSNYLGGTDHVDPTDYWSESANDYFGSDYDVEDFVELVQAYYNTL